MKDFDDIKMHGATIKKKITPRSYNRDPEYCNAFSQKGVIQSVKIHNNLVFRTFCHHCPLPLLCRGSAGPLSTPLFYNVFQSLLLSIITTFEVHGKT
jgi:hypothetical protein